jgi:hypothetical protein
MENPHLTKYIHTFRFYVYAPFDHDGCWDLLRPGPALRAMKNLKELYIQAGHNKVPDDILDNCPFQLLSCSFGGFPPTHTLRLFLRFLATQHDLRHLRSIIPWYDLDIGPLDLPGCTKLQHIEGSGRSMMTFLRGRNISSLVWIHTPADRPSFQCLSRELGLLKKLSFQLPNFAESLEVLDNLVRNLQNLQYLELGISVSRPVTIQWRCC